MQERINAIEQQRDELQLERDNYKSVAEAHSGAFQECIRLREQRDELLAASQAVIDRWETPLWKDAPATAEYIYALRDVVDKVQK